STIRACLDVPASANARPVQRRKRPYRRQGRAWHVRYNRRLCRLHASHRRNMVTNCFAPCWHRRRCRDVYFNRSQVETVILAAALALLCLLLVCCRGPAPQKGGHARHTSPTGARSEMTQPENPKDAATQKTQAATEEQ